MPAGPFLFCPFDAGARPAGSGVSLRAGVASNVAMSPRSLVPIVTSAMVMALTIAPVLAAQALHGYPVLEGGAVPARGPMSGIGLMALLALGTFASEDGACIAAGALVASGQLGFVPAALGCVAGIFAGDLGLFFAGRIVGRRIARWRPFRRVLSAESLAACAAWLEARGAWVVIVSRFLPGTRVPTYIGAGVLGVNAWLFTSALAAAAILWTPLLVGASAIATAWTVPTAGIPGPIDTTALVATSVGVLYLLRRVATRGERRRLLAVWRRATRWEFWPPWVLYPPVLAWIALLMVRHRSATVFTAANPGMPAGGFVGESKSEILGALQHGGAPVAPFALLAVAAGAKAGISRALSFADEHGWPLVLKPDQGQRGTGVRIVRSREELVTTVAALPRDTIVQAYVPGIEFGIFYARRLHEPHGRIVSLTGKRFPVVTGNGRHTLEQLILDDARAVALWRKYSSLHADRLHTVVTAGARVQLCEVGSHCRGAVFLDAHGARTAALEAEVDRASKAMPGFFFGRFDVRSASVEDLRRGQFTILELNGVTSEPTHIYDAVYGALAAWRTLCASWTLAFAIGAEQAAAGARVWYGRELVGLAFGYRRFARVPRCNPAGPALIEDAARSWGPR
jgi:membrane protein DedA with SNARE-associated domain